MASHSSALRLCSLPSRCLPRDPGGTGKLRVSGMAMEDGEGLLRDWVGGRSRQGLDEEEGSWVRKWRPEMC